MSGTSTETPAGVPRGQVALAPFLAFCAQLTLLWLVIDAFGVEERSGLLELAPLAFVGFAAQAFLPLGWRQPLFLALSVAGFLIVFGVASGATLLGIGAALVAVCHLPVPWALRFVLLAAGGAWLTAMRGSWIEADWATGLLPILGSIFMFRLVLYVYDLRTENSPATLSERLTYFFMLPNAMFPLFPIVDWKAWRRNWFDKDATDIYRKGTAWMIRGVFHLLLYRLIYRNFTPGPEDVESAGTLVLYMTSSYALYLRVSGLFHLIVGMLCMFGFNLPETHHHYFLASGFNDLWRRINIYWKDFMMKIVYYPIFVRMRRKDATRAMVVATVAVFFFSWLLHSYQWFWILGDFPLTVVDVIFWTIFAITVLANSLLQARGGARRSLGGRQISARAAVVHATKVVAMFSWMCLLWSFWTSTGIESWTGMLAASAEGPAVQWAWLGAGLVGAVALGALFQVFVQRPYEACAEDVTFTGETAGNVVFLGALLWLGTPDWSGFEDEPLVTTVRVEGLNDRDQELQLRGYYEEILEGDRKSLGGLWETQLEKPADWVQLTQTEALRRTHDIRERELVPNLAMPFRDSVLTTNSHGMRDIEYSKAKPDGTFRIALLGASIEMGSGVEAHEVFEAIVEERLNRENPGHTYERYEILNFAVSGSTPLSHVVTATQIVPEFEPDLILFFCHPVDGRLMQRHIERLLDKSIPIEYDVLARFLHEAGMRGGMTEEQSKRVYNPIRDHVMGWTYSTVKSAGDRMGAKTAWVYLQHPPEQSEARIARGRALFQLAKDRGLTPIRLDGANIYSAGRDWHELIVAPWDDHPNAEGHALIAEELWRQLMAHDGALGLGFTEPDD